MVQNDACMCLNREKKFGKGLSENLYIQYETESLVERFQRVSVYKMSAELPILVYTV